MTYGFEIRNSDGEIIVDSNLTTIRIVHKEFCRWDYSGSFQVPNFDSDFGEFYIKPQFTVGAAPTSPSDATLISTGFNYTYDFRGTQTSTGGLHDAGYYITFPDGRKPTLSWDNSSKTMTVTPAIRPLKRLDGDWTNGGDYNIVFFEVA
jgi:hypothetical protein